MPKTIAVLATLDTKGQEAEFLREQLKALGSRALVVDMGRTRHAGRARRRLQTTRGNAVLMLLLLGTGRCAMPGGPLNDPDGDAISFAELKAHVPSGIEVVERPAHAEDPAFVAEAVDRLVALVERR